MVRDRLPWLGLRSPPDFSHELAIIHEVSPNPPRPHTHLLNWCNPIEGRTIPRKQSTVLARKPSNIPGVPPEQQHASKYQGLGGFPGPIRLANQALKLVIPHTYNMMERTMTMTTVTTLQSTAAPWLNFNGLVVGRNSDFRTDSLTDSELEDLGGAEYRALKLLSWLVPTVCGYPALFSLLGLWVYLWPFFCCSILLYVSFWRYFFFCHGFLSRSRMTASLRINRAWYPNHGWSPGAEPRCSTDSSCVRFAFFQVMGAYTGGGLSLVDA